MFDYDPLDFIAYEDLTENEKENLKKYYEVITEIAESLDY